MKDPRAGARAIVLLLGVIWGGNWIAVRVALGELGPWTLRAIAMTLSALILMGLAWLQGRSLALPPGRARLHIAVAGVLNLGAFNVLLSFAQLGSATSRAAIVTFTMPLWAAALARLILGERLDRLRAAALLLGAVGLAILLLPFLIAGHIPIGLFFALGAAVSWATGTVYLKHVRIVGEPLAIAAWQLAVGAAVAGAGMLVSEGLPPLRPLAPETLAALAYHVVLANALAYLLWFDVMTRLPAATLALGTLLVPVVGVAGAILFLHEHPTPTDFMGFALVLAAAASVLLRPGMTATAAPARRARSPIAPDLPSSYLRP